MMTGANAIRAYTSQEIVPVTPAEKDGKFVPQTVPAYAAQRNFQPIQAAFAGYSYREAALNPTNLANRAQDWEADIINGFRSEPVPERVFERDTPNGPVLYLTRPITVRDEACLTCHTTPAEAPAAMTRAYGVANGFGWKMNETIGAQILSVPMAVPLRLAQTAFQTFLMVVIAVLAVIVIVLNVLLHYLVIRPVARVSRMADAVSLGEPDVEVYVKPGKDEISSLSISFNRMRESLDKAMEMLRG